MLLIEGKALCVNNHVGSGSRTRLPRTVAGREPLPTRFSCHRHAMAGPRAPMMSRATSGRGSRSSTGQSPVSTCQHPSSVRLRDGVRGGDPANVPTWMEGVGTFRTGNVRFLLNPFNDVGVCDQDNLGEGCGHIGERREEKAERREESVAKNWEIALERGGVWQSRPAYES